MLKYIFDRGGGEDSVDTQCARMICMTGTSGDFCRDLLSRDFRRTGVRIDMYKADFVYTRHHLPFLSRGLDRFMDEDDR